MTIPLALGRPPAGRAVEEANAVIEAHAAAAGALVVDLRGFGAQFWNTWNVRISRVMSSVRLMSVPSSLVLIALTSACAFLGPRPATKGSSVCV